MSKLDPKVIFNALQDATHIFAFKEEKTEFKILTVISSEDSTKAVVELRDGAIVGLFTDTASARSALLEVKNVFGDDQPWVIMKMKETAKKQSIYYIEVL